MFDTAIAASLIGATLVSAIPADITPRGNAFKAPQYTVNHTRSGAVKDAFVTAWNGYVQYAFPHDSLAPVDNTYQDDRNGWGASAIDALDTAIIMNHFPAVNKILDFVPTINFNYSATDISFFETSIRYLGGLEAAYDLLSTNDKAKHLGVDPSKLPPLLSQARLLADNLKLAYDTPSGININGMNFYGPGNISIHHDPQSGTAGCTLPIEWGRLSDLTGDVEYQNLNIRAVSHFLHPNPSWAEPFPGLVGANYDPDTGEAVTADGGWIAGTDSYYEYLMKAWIQNKDVYGEYKDTWVRAADSAMQYLASNPSSRPDLTFLGEFHNTTIIYQGQHLGCFAGGSFILGGLSLGEQKYIDFGLKLTEGCHDTYVTSSQGIGPDLWAWQDKSQNATTNPPPADQQDRYNKDGYWNLDSSYRLRPEVLESYYYAYRATGDSKYQDWSFDAFQAINKACRVGSGYAELNDVNDPSKGYTNLMDSFFFAEVLKYAYLIHIEDSDYQVKADQTNKFVYNTEAHPVRIANNRQA